MSKSQNPTSESVSLGLRSASYMPCRNCEEGSLVWDELAEETRCRCCGVAA